MSVNSLDAHATLVTGLRLVRDGVCDGGGWSPERIDVLLRGNRPNQPGIIFLEQASAPRFCI